MINQNISLTDSTEINSADNKRVNENGYSSYVHKTEIPEDINDFVYSKKSHLKFFKDNYYDFDLFGKEKSIEEFSIYDYQLMLCYFFILKHIDTGSKILLLGSKYLEIHKQFTRTKKFECWILEDVECLSEELTFLKNEPDIYKHNDRREKLRQPLEYFDFIYSLSEFDLIKFDQTKDNYKKINNNLKKFLKPGGYGNFMFTVAFENGAYHLNNFLYSFFTEYFPTVNFKINYFNPSSIEINSNLFSTEFEYTKLKYINFSNKDKTFKVNVFSYNILIQKKVAEIPKNSSYNPEFFRKKKPAYFFHHLIKCGGSSIGAVLEKWFQFENDLYDKVDGTLGYDYDGNVNKFKKYKFNLENISSDTCIRGHFQHEGIFIDQRYPEIFKRPNEFKVFTFVREPMNVLYSLYYFGKKRDYDYQTISLKTYLKTTKNFLAYLLNCDDSNYKEILDRYFFIGIVDRMQESFDKFASIIGKRKITVPVFNTTEKDSQIAELTPEFIAEIKKQNELDYKIYNYCLEKFNKL